MCRADAPHQKGPIHQADRPRPRTRHCDRYYPLTENQTFRQVLSTDREPDISPGIIHRPRTRHFTRYFSSTENHTFRQVFFIDRDPDISPGIFHRPKTRHFARYYPSTENQIFRQVLFIDRELDISPGINHRPRTGYFARYYPSTENQTFRQVLSIDREPDISLGIIQVEVHYINLCACWVPDRLTDNHDVSCMGFSYISQGARFLRCVITEEGIRLITLNPKSSNTIGVETPTICQACKMKATP